MVLVPPSPADCHGSPRRPLCRYCDREFEDEKVLITHQKAKHFKCLYCHKKLNSGSGLVIHIAQLHKETIFKIPNALEGHDTPEVEIYGMEGIPAEDLERRRRGESFVAYKRSKLTEPGAGMLPLLAAQKAAIPEEAPVAPMAQMAPVPVVTSPVSSASSTGAKPGEASVMTSGPISYASPPMMAQGQFYPPQYGQYYGAPPPGPYGYYPAAGQFGHPPYYGSQPYGMPPPQPYSSSYPPMAQHAPVSPVAVPPMAPHPPEQTESTTESETESKTDTKTGSEAETGAALEPAAAAAPVQAVPAELACPVDAVPSSSLTTANV